MMTITTTPEHQLKDFTTWFASNGGHINPAVAFAHSPQKGVHLRVVDARSFASPPLGDAEPGVLVLSCPHALTLSALNAANISNLFPGGDPHGDNNRSSSSGSTSGPVFPRALLVSARPQCVAAFFLAYQALLGAAGFWSPYIRCLPRPPPPLPQDAEHEHGEDGARAHAGGIGELDTPVDWPAARSLLRGTAAERGAAELVRRWRGEWEAWAAVMDGWLAASGVGDGDGRGRFDWPTFKWAMTILGSRAFSSGQISAVRAGNPTDDDDDRILDRYDPDMLLYPGVDFLNHDAATRNRWVQDERRFGVKVYETGLRDGDEVVYSYGAKDNGQLLLSYGFCIQENPDESFALKLSPLSPNSVVEAAVRESRLKGGVGAQMSQGRRGGATTREATPFERPASHAPPPSHNPAENTYYIRTTCSSSAATQQHPGYPRGPYYLTPFPIDLINTLFGKLANAREVRDAMPLDMTLLYEQLDGRVQLSVMVLLLGRLRVELQRLQQGWNEDVGEGDERWQSRRAWADMYRESQKKLLVDVIGRLEGGVDEALFRRMAKNKESGKSLRKGSLVTLASGVSFVHSLLRESANLDSGLDELTSFNNGLEVAFGTGSDVEAWRADGMEEDVWTIVIGVALGRLQSAATNSVPVGEADGVHHGLKIWLGRLQRIYSSTSSVVTDNEEQTTEAEQEIIAHVLEILSAIRQSCSEGIIWREETWTIDLVRTAVRIVREETLQAVLAEEAYGRLRVSEAEVFSREGDAEMMEIEELEGVVALYVE